MTTQNHDTRVFPGSSDRTDPIPEDWVPFKPQTATVATLLQFAMQYRNDEPRLSKVMLELLSRDWSQHREQVRALQWRWEYLVRTTQPPRWPSSAITKRERAFLGNCFQCGDHGMLAFFGYHVGVTQGLVNAVRRDILDYIYKGDLPLVSDEAYTQSWGSPSSPMRLRKMATTLAHLARNAMAKENRNYHTAISEWAADLRYIKSMYFRPFDNPEHDWPWPEVDVD